MDGATTGAQDEVEDWRRWSLLAARGGSPAAGGRTGSMVALSRTGRAAGAFTPSAAAAVMRCVAAGSVAGCATMAARAAFRRLCSPLEWAPCTLQEEQGLTVTTVGSATYPAPPQNNRYDLFRKKRRRRSASPGGGADLVPAYPRRFGTGALP